MRINSKRTPGGPQPGAVGKKWGILGVTTINEELEVAEIEVRFDPVHDAPIILAEYHERGHVAVVEDIINGVPRDDALAVLDEYDRWQNEVEAWGRIPDDNLAYEDGTFILDCLNSYRRGLGISDEEWEAGREVITSTIISVYARPALREYEPIEPDPDEPPPSGCCHIDGEADGDGGEEEGKDKGDDSGEDGDGDGDGKLINVEVQRDTKYEQRWLDEDTLRLLEKNSIESVAVQRGLDVQKTPPGFEAIVKLHARR